MKVDEKNKVLDYCAEGKTPPPRFDPDDDFFEDFRYYKSETYCTVDRYRGSDSNVEIPSLYKGLPVEYIGREAFSKSLLSTLTIPDSIKAIEEKAFYGCKFMKSVSIGNGLTRIGRYAFYQCYALSDLTIPDSVTDIGESAFSTCFDILETDNGVKYVDRWAVGREWDLSGVVALRAGTTGIGDRAFRNSKLTEINFSDGVKCLGWEAFANCSNLKSVTLPKTITYISGSLFMGCDNLTNIIYLGTKKEWKAINKTGVWNSGLSDACTLTCSDGILTREEAR